jgi:hypothetical protein
MAASGRHGIFFEADGSRSLVVRVLHELSQHLRGLNAETPDTAFLTVPRTGVSVTFGDVSVARSSVSVAFGDVSAARSGVSVALGDVSAGRGDVSAPKSRMSAPDPWMPGGRGDASGALGDGVRGHGGLSVPLRDVSAAFGGSTMPRRRGNPARSRSRTAPAGGFHATASRSRTPSKYRIPSSPIVEIDWRALCRTSGLARNAMPNPASRSIGRSLAPSPTAIT